ncbi:hypothetical protein [Enhygromyxa salina]|uniref:hypothetical protein n=1 Tax=Enhygromyxa salina TaxID=215803 RepID=UPI0011B1D354|nr:hypothetical protein [Enhygromyxa salina]
MKAPNDKLNIVGFADPTGAFTYYRQGFPRVPKDALFNVSISRNESTEFTGAPRIVFWVGGGTGQPRMLSIMQCHGDLPQLVVESWGAQMLIGRT